jgi:hypothetical protein
MARRLGAARAASHKAKWAWLHGPASAQVAWRERGGVHALPVVTTRWPRARRRSGTTNTGGSGAQPW